MKHGFVLLILLIKWRVNERCWLTRATTSLAARAIISVHDTRPGHWASTASLALFTVSKPSPARDILSWASLSASPLLDAINTDASHPYTITNHMNNNTNKKNNTRRDSRWQQGYIHRRSSRERTFVMLPEPWWWFVGI